MPAIRTHAAVLVAIVLAGCSDGERESPPAPDPATTDPVGAANTADPGVGFVRLINSGAEPRVRLRISSRDPVNIPVRAHSRTDGSIGDEPFAQEVAAAYSLVIDLSTVPGSDERLARFYPSITDVTGFVAPADPGSWQWRLTAEGVPTETESPVAASVGRGKHLRELLSNPALFLIVPPEPVGAGARWTFGSASTGEPVTIHLVAIDDEGLTANWSMQNTLPGAHIELTATGRWHRESLVALEAKSVLDVRYTATTTRNGDEVQLQAGRRIEHSYGAAP